VFAGLRVPEVLVGGDHARIRRWRLKQALGKTWRVRPDLLLSADRPGIEGRSDIASRAERAELLNELLQERQGLQGPANED
jgi:tRNA (guanine37-N1)-methyltransferase